MIDWTALINQDPWAYFNLPPDEEARLRILFTAKVGPHGMVKFVDSILYDLTYDDPKRHPEKFITGIGDSKQIAGATLFVVGDFIAQYNKLGRRYKLPLLPKEIMGFFRHPYNQFQDLNLKSQYRIVKALNKNYKRGLEIYGT